MTKTIGCFWRMLMGICALLFLFSLSSESFAHECPVFEPDRHTCMQYHAFLNEIRTDADAVRCVVHRCSSLSVYDWKIWRHKAYYADCEREHYRRKNTANFKEVPNPPSVDELHCNYSSGLHRREPYRREIFGIYDTPDPLPGAAQPNKYADYDGGTEGGTAGSAKPKQPGTVTMEGLTRLRSEQSGYRARMLLGQQPAAKPPSESRPVGSLPVATPVRRPRMNCIPPNVSIVSIADNGDLTLYNDTGADFLQYEHCFPNHELDPQKVAEANPFKATVAYYRVHSDRPLNKTRLEFCERRWKLKRGEWDLSGKEAYKDFFAENKGKKFGIALQGKQRLHLAAKAGSDETSAPKAVAPVKPAKTDGGARIKPWAPNINRYASVPDAAILGDRPRVSQPHAPQEIGSSKTIGCTASSAPHSLAHMDRRPLLSYPYGKRAIPHASRMTPAVAGARTMQKPNVPAESFAGTSNLSDHSFRSGVSDMSLMSVSLSLSELLPQRGAA